MFGKLKKLLGGASAGATNDQSRDKAGVGETVGTSIGAADSANAPLGATAFGPMDGSSKFANTSTGAMSPEALAQWAKSIRADLSKRSSGAPALSGSLRGKPWRMEMGRSSRDYIKGTEIRLRAELGIGEDTVVLIITRQLKDQLEKAAYSVYTDPLQTTVDPNMPEEMRWLAMYEEYGWEDVGLTFFDQYAVLADSRSHATDFVTPELAALLLLSVRNMAHGDQVPMVLMLMRGKAYMRTSHDPADLRTLQEVHKLFTAACDSAIDHLSTDLAV